MKFSGKIRRIADHINTVIDNFALKKKLFLLYLLCVLIPVTLLDGVLFANLLSKETKRQDNEMENVANAIQYDIAKTMDDAVFITKDYWLNQTVNDFLSTKYNSAYDFFKRYDDIENNSIIDVSLVGHNASLHLYADNNSIINGGKFGKDRKSVV